MDIGRRTILYGCLFALCSPWCAAGDAEFPWSHELAGTWFHVEVVADVLARPEGEIVVSGRDERRRRVTADVIVRVESDHRMHPTLSLWVPGDDGWFVQDEAGELYFTRDGDIRRLLLEVPLGDVHDWWGDQGVLGVDVDGDLRSVRRIGGPLRMEMISRPGRCAGRVLIDGVERAVSGAAQLRMRRLTARDLPASLRRALRVRRAPSRALTARATSRDPTARRSP